MIACKVCRDKINAVYGYRLYEKVAHYLCLKIVSSSYFSHQTKRNGIDTSTPRQAVSMSSSIAENFCSDGFHSFRCQHNFQIIKLKYSSFFYGIGGKPAIGSPIDQLRPIEIPPETRTSQPRGGKRSIRWNLRCQPFMWDSLWKGCRRREGRKRAGSNEKTKTFILRWLLWGKVNWINLIRSSFRDVVILQDWVNSFKGIVTVYILKKEVNKDLSVVSHVHRSLESYDTRTNGTNAKDYQLSPNAAAVDADRKADWKPNELRYTQSAR